MTLNVSECPRRNEDTASQIGKEIIESRNSVVRGTTERNIINKTSKQAQDNPLRFISASEVHDFVFCQRSWGYWRRRIEPPREALKKAKDQFEYGNDYHKKNGEKSHREEVSRQGRQQSACGDCSMIIGRAFFNTAAYSGRKYCKCLRT